MIRLIQNSGGRSVGNAWGSCPGANGFTVGIGIRATTVIRWNVDMENSPPCRMMPILVVNRVTVLASKARTSCR